MLTHICIKDFAIVDALEISFSEGLNVLTGETGAGKSLWVDAVSLALGQRADSQWIRQGAERADITAIFDISTQPDAQLALKTDELDQGHELILRRTLSRQGTSRSTINGTPLPLQRIRELSASFIQIHSQHQQQHLLHSDKQRDCLDNFAKNNSLLKNIGIIYQQWKMAEEEIQALQNSTQNKEQEIDFLKYQLDELNALHFKPNEWQILSRQHQQLHNTKQLIEQITQAIELTVENEEVSAAQLIQQAMHQLNSLKSEDIQLRSILELLHTAAIHLNEAGTELYAYRNHVDLSSHNLIEIETRLSHIYDLSRKHHCSPENLAEVHASLQHKLDRLLSLDEKISALRVHQTHLLEHYQNLAQQLTQNRIDAAKELEQHITQSMQHMDIHEGKFKVTFTPIDGKLSLHGNEKIQFLVQTNVGQDFQPLQKIASGGEISRISLALYVLTANKEQTPTLIFDEVDVGISGKTAAIVGKLLRELGEKTQVLCITHLPQVASYAHHHYKVYKTSTDTHTTTGIEKLNTEQRVHEIARLLGGTEITKQSLAHASELLALA